MAFSLQQHINLSKRLNRLRQDIVDISHEYLINDENVTSEYGIMLKSVDKILEQLRETARNDLPEELGKDLYIPS